MRMLAPTRYWNSVNFVLLLTMLLTIVTCNGSNNDNKKTVALHAPLPLASAATADLPADFCSPRGTPIDGSQFRGSNSFALCQRGEKINTQNWGQVEELYIRCRPESLRNGWRWHIWCNSDGSHCACDRKGIIANPSDKTCCDFTAGSHCTAKGEARPGQNGCAAW